VNRSPDELGYVEAVLTMRRTEDGGRKSPIRSGYRPNWWLPGEAGNVWAGGTVELTESEELAPGGMGTVRIYPFVPEVWSSLQTGSALEMCEGPALIGKGTVTQVVPAKRLVGAH
jgi:hypothetical protein